MVWSSSSLLLALEALFGFEESIEKGGSSKSSAASPGRAAGIAAVAARLDSLWALPPSLWIGSRRLALPRVEDLPLAASSSDGQRRPAAIRRALWNPKIWDGAGRFGIRAA